MKKKKRIAKLEAETFLQDAIINNLKVTNAGLRSSNTGLLKQRNDALAEVERQRCLLAEQEAQLQNQPKVETEEVECFVKELKWKGYGYSNEMVPKKLTVLKTPNFVK